MFYSFKNHNLEIQLAKESSLLYNINMLFQLSLIHPIDKDRIPDLGLYRGQNVTPDSGEMASAAVFWLQRLQV